MPKILLFICLFLAICLPGFSSVPKVKPLPKHAEQELRLDSSKIRVRVFNNQALQQFSKEKEFQYDDNAKPASQSLWSRFWDWFWSMIGRIFRAGFFHGFSLFSIILFVVFIGFLVYIAFKVSGIGFGNIFKGKVNKVEIPYAESLENIHEISFDAEIDKAVEQRNYRLAVRLLYLRSLKQLSDAQLIHWQIEKTNSAYLNELTDDGQRQSFGLLTKQFEYVWYGDFFVDGQAFQNLNNLFQDFKQMLR